MQRFSGCRRGRLVWLICSSINSSPTLVLDFVDKGNTLEHDLRGVRTSSENARLRKHGANAFFEIESVVL